MEKILKKSKSFVLGVCACGCSESIQIRTGRLFRRFKNLHQNRGINNPKFCGYKSYIDHEGYIHTYSSTRKDFFREHRLLWEKYHNACLLPLAVIHHKNGIKSDNRMENLVAFHNNNAHLKSHQKDLSNYFCRYWKQRWNWLFYGQSLGLNQFTKFI